MILRNVGVAIFAVMIALLIAAVASCAPVESQTPADKWRDANVVRLYDEQNGVMCYKYVGNGIFCVKVMP